MPTFTYTARTRDGKRQKGTMTAESRQALTQMLAAKGLIVENAAEAGKTVKPSVASANARRKVKSTDLLVFTRQLATIVSSGLPLLQGLDILAEQSEDPNFSAVILACAQDVENGESFSNAIGKFPRAFPDLYVSMVRAGEAGGDLDGVLLQLADYMEASEELRRRIKSAMTYPVVAFSMILLIAIGLIVWVVPQFATIFASFGTPDKPVPLPAPTLILIKISDTLGSWVGLAVLGAVIAVVFAVRAYGRTPSGRYNLDVLKLRLPIFGILLRKVAISRFTRTLSTLTRSGVAILHALEIAERTAGNEVFARVVKNAGDSVRNGETLAEPLARSEQFPPMVTRMIGVGEKTGALEGMLLKIAEFYDSEVKAMVDSMTSLIEPILIMFMGIVVGGIVVALFMPILMLSSLVGK
ncbi:MAG TPA: type II secretion system F family protein [Candidatus Hydrogenedentes bacterium]|nr:type II secretion system F family protein [Candidatus Hydrogenedentota bacterium]